MKKLLLLALLQSISCFGAEETSVAQANNVQESNAKSVAKIGGHTVIGSASGFMSALSGTIAINTLNGLLTNKYYKIGDNYFDYTNAMIRAGLRFSYTDQTKIVVIGALSAIALGWLAKKQYQKAWNVYKKMKNTTSNTVAACTQE